MIEKVIDSIESRVNEHRTRISVYKTVLDLKYLDNDSELAEEIRRRLDEEIKKRGETLEILADVRELAEEMEDKEDD